MLCFVMSLKSRALSRDWRRVVDLCEASVRSALQQTDPNVKVLLVCHEPPEFSPPFDERLEIIQVDFPTPEETLEAMMRDKWRKLHVGMIRAGQLKPDFVMFMDADDLVSNRLAAHATRNPQSNGWIIRRGFQYSYGSRWIKPENDFNCGTNAIVNARLIEFPQDMSEESFRRCIVLRWGHTKIAEKLAEAGTPLEPLPFRGSVYISFHGENYTGFFDAMPGKRWISSLRHFVRHPHMIVPCTKRIRREFSMRAEPA